MIGTAIGSLPGLEYDEAVRLVLGELPDLPHVPELPDRGVGAEMIGRTLGLIGGLDADLQPVGWRLTGTSGAPGVDQRRARSLLSRDLDTVEEFAQGYRGRFKTQVTGPWTLAANVEKPRGDKVLSDHGARRDLAEALAEAIGAHVGDLRRRVAGAAEIIVQIDEPALAAVMAGAISTASGFGKHRTVEVPAASALLETVFAAVTEAGATPWVHSCAAGTPWGLLRDAGARGLLVDLSQLDAADFDQTAEAIEAGLTVGLGVVPSTDSTLPDTRIVDRVLRWLDIVGLDAEEHGDRIVVTPSCGLAGASPAYARTALALVRTSAAALS